MVNQSEKVYLFSSSDSSKILSAPGKELTEEEKEEQLKELEENWKTEEELLRSQAAGQDILEQAGEQQDSGNGQE